MDSKPVTRLPESCRLDELWPVPRERASLRFPRVPAAILAQDLHLEELLHRRGRLPQGLGAARARGRSAGARVEAARRWLEERLAVPGGLGGIFPAMTNAVLALRTLGYPEDHPLIRGPDQGDRGAGRRDQARRSTTSRASRRCGTPRSPLNALVESGLPADHPQLQRAAEWMIDKQITVPGDWQVKRPHVPPGGWPFQYDNDFYPDLDDTAMVMMALHQVRGLDPERRRRGASTAASRWFLGMQGSDGGWGSFDADNNRLIFNNIPFADHGALLDPSTEDLTGRGLELLGTLGEDASHPAARRALAFIRRTQSHGRVLVRALGRQLHLRHVVGAARRGCHRRGRLAGLRPARGRLARGRARIADGGWGETLASYDDAELAGRGESIPSQTAWALLGLFAAGHMDGPEVERGIRYLFDRQRPDGTWEDPLWNGTGFPRVFYLKYHLYAKYFPLWALGVYRSARS